MRTLLVRCSSPLKYLSHFIDLNLISSVLKPVIRIERPSNLAYLASSMIQNGLECDILDLGTCIPNKKIEVFKKNITKYDFVGFTFLTMYYNEAINLAKIAKELNPKIKVIMGGPHASFDRELIKNKYVDYIIRSEGERALVDLISGKPLKKVPNLIYKKNRKVIENPLQLIKNLDSLPFPLREKCKPIHFKYWKYEEMLTSRGCNNLCSFCVAPRMFPRLRLRDPKNIVDEIESLVSRGISKFKFISSNFTAYKKHTLNLCNEIKNRNLNIIFWADACIETTDAQILKAIKEAGGIGVNFGLESINKKNLIYSQKAMNPSNYYKKFKKLANFCKKINLGYTIYYIVGFPNQTIDELKREIKLLEKYPKHFYIFTPFLGTLEWERMKDNIIENDFSKYDTYHKVIKTEIPEDYVNKIIKQQFIKNEINLLVDKIREIIHLN